jgi:hypothetical protein
MRHRALLREGGGLRAPLLSSGLTGLTGLTDCSGLTGLTGLAGLNEARYDRV